MSPQTLVANLSTHEKTSHFDALEAYFKEQYYEETNSFCDAYQNCTQNLMKLSEVCAMVFKEVQHEMNYNFSSFYRYLLPLNNVDLKCREQESELQIAVNFALDQVKSYNHWCIRRTCFTISARYHGQISRFSEQSIQKDNCSIWIEHLSNMCNRLKNCCLPAKICERTEKYRQITTVYTNLMRDLISFKDRCYYAAFNAWIDNL
ncbi:unnamed protein product [Thelazia callipaeda]|uniref:Protein farnesyltransferase/geranylgeranyltransferase type-1 subunit alpha n=1 Tax=Thelazia callipaeda TaxID=103827 RepID=A0A0N5CNL5_THECL|nr:unnamed protein product [Thelazia callipaeda]